MLSVGDAVCNLAGRHWGRIKTRLNPHKALEGTLAGILFSAPVAWFFVHDWPAAVLSTTVAMFLELPHVSLFGFEIDDNLLIPLATGVGLTLFA